MQIMTNLITLLNSPRTITSGTRNLVLSNMGNCFSLWKRSTIIGILSGSTFRTQSQMTFYIN
ncbi:hypothetical protein DERP_005679 [Dermatophagoides pteronyssinus]|uniref:Uncharacterized protein n=1 Tax=Dermatophagoides pteronyssinus TaxID=6956 RepID=A0ABQ8J9Q9_DERPT|nr:hypothetical protein DERP_005679 [Dermatophagoides pteronyssinus]